LPALYWNDASHLINVVVTFRRRFDAAATVGIPVHERLQLAGVYHTLRIAVCLVAGDDQRYVRRPRPCSAGRVASLRQIHLLLEATRLVEAFPTVDAVYDEEQVACDIDVTTKSDIIIIIMTSSYICIKWVDKTQPNIVYRYGKKQ